MSFVDEVREVHARIEPHLRRTPLEASPMLSERSGCPVFLKLENFQRTGSFKIRGALSKLTRLGEDQRARGIVAASSGNHGLAVAQGAADLGCPARIFVPSVASASKVEAIRRLGAEVVEQGSDCVESEAAARENARRHGSIYLSPYNDEDVIAGQGTLGLELLEQRPTLRGVVTSLGGGGLISGVGGFLKEAVGDLLVLAASPRESCVMHESLREGHIVQRESGPTLSDGTAGGVEPDSVTFPRCQRVVDESRTVSEAEIRQTMRELIRDHRFLVEGAAAVAVAAFLQDPRPFAGREVAIVLCGGNVGLDVLRDVL